MQLMLVWPCRRNAALSKASQLSQRAFMAYEAIISCTADLLWWIQAENVAVDMVGVGEKSDSESQLHWFNHRGKWQSDLHPSGSRSWTQWVCAPPRLSPRCLCNTCSTFVYSHRCSLVKWPIWMHFWRPFSPCYHLKGVCGQEAEDHEVTVHL